MNDEFFEIFSIVEIHDYSLYIILFNMYFVLKCVRLIQKRIYIPVWIYI